MFYKRLLVIAFTGLAFFNPDLLFSQDQKLNVLLFTADDLDRNSLGCYGSKVEDITPNLDKFAAEGLKVNHAYVNAAICAPSRAILATGLYGHNSGAMGFMKMKDGSRIPLIMEILRENNYEVGILGKVSHSTPKNEFKWDFAYDQHQLGDGRSPTLYYNRSKEFFQTCREKNRPFYFMVNSHDPHRPYFNPKEPNEKGGEVPSRIYAPEEIEIPGFVPDLPMVRTELSFYFNSVRRLDDTFGKVMQALEESGFKENTLVVFISDNGIAIPFAKCNAYYASNRTPWLVRWPGVTEPGTVDNKNFISEVDFFPTVLDALGINPPTQLDGRSHLALYKGKNLKNADMVFTQIDYKAGGGPVPMRSVQNDKYAYIFNGWFDGERVYGNNNEGMTMRALENAAANDPAMADRVKLFRFRVLEEFYDLEKDPDCLKNLVNDQKCKKELDAMRREMSKRMAETNDPLLPVFENKNSSANRLQAFYKAYPDAKKWDEDKSNFSK